MLWSERRGGAADLAGTPVQTGRDVAESHREDAAGKGRRSTARRKEPWPNDNNIAPIARSNRGYERISQLVLMAYSMENSNVFSYSLKMDILTVLLVRLKTSDHCVNPVES